MWTQMKDLNFGRTVFREPQSSSLVDSVLEKYANAIRSSSNGALLFSVVGKKSKRISRGKGSVVGTYIFSPSACFSETCVYIKG